MYELLTVKRGRVVGPATMNLARTGNAWLSRAATDMIAGKGDYCQLLYDRERKMIGIRVGVDKTAIGARKICGRRGGSVAFISFKGFTRYFGIDVEGGIGHLPVTFNESENMLEAKLG